jgi:ATP-binding cassette subfamily B protein
MTPAGKPISFFTVVRFAAGYWRRQPVKLIFVLILVLASAATETYLPTALANFLAAIRAHAAHTVVLFGLGVFLGAYLLQTIFEVSRWRVYNVFETIVFKNLVDDAFAHVHRLSEHFFVNTFTGSIISRILRGRSQIEIFEDRLLTSLLPTAVILTGSTIFLAFRFPMLALLLAIYLVILTGVIVLLVLRMSGPAQGLYAAEQDKMTAQLADSVSGISTSKAYAQEEREIERFTIRTDRLQVVNARAFLLGNMAGAIQRVLLTGMLALLLGGGVWYYFRGEATEENMAYLAFAYTIMQSYVRELGEHVRRMLTAAYDLHAVIRLIREEPEVPVVSPLPALNICEGAIVFDKVTFAYPGKSEPVFDGLSISIRAGERVALVGHSGSGKTTFVRLLQCLYTIQSGRISIDGQDITAGSRHSLRNAIALVPQDPILFHRSLRENIAYGQPDASFAQIEAAAEQAHIRTFIESLPDKYETLVGERGIKLSGGERQRIAIARALLADRPILILDEATSSLDSGSERAIQEALHSLTHGRTSIMIAHRLSTILDADRILVFDKGRIVEEGTHDQLLAITNGIYAGFFALQSGGFIED